VKSLKMLFRGNPELYYYGSEQYFLMKAERLQAEKIF